MKNIHPSAFSPHPLFFGALAGRPSALAAAGVVSIPLFTGCANLWYYVTMTEILTLFKPDFVFSLAFFVGFLGFGIFVNNSFFPWFKEYMAMRQASHEIQQKRFDILMEIMTEFKSELSAFRETHSIILAYLISDLTENEPEKPTDTAAARALKRRQTTQDLLLRRLEGVDENDGTKTTPAKKL